MMIELVCIRLYRGLFFKNNPLACKCILNILCDSDCFPVGSDPMRVTVKDCAQFLVAVSLFLFLFLRLRLPLEFKINVVLELKIGLFCELSVSGFGA